VTAYHAGVTGTFDKFKVVAALAGDSSGYWNGLASAQVSLDMFKLAGAVEGGSYSNSATNTATGPAGEALAGKSFFGAGASASLAVSDGVTINVGGRYFDQDTSTANTEGYQGAVALIAAITETLTLEGDLGVYGTNNGGVGTAAVPGAPAVGASGVPAGLATGTVTAAGCTVGTFCNIYYGAAQVTWAPGGGFTSSLKGEAFSNGAYRATFNASKAFQ